MIKNYWRRKLFRKIARRNDWRVYCGLCGKPMGLDEATLDHIVPRALGGSNHHSNLQFAHGPCNWRKGANYEEPIVFKGEKKRVRPSVQALFESLGPDEHR
jgi:5-methylcytosine-specific restriction endonuclease McrA